jgi:hypothetical protein
VSEPGPPEVLLQDGVHRPGVAHDQAGQQPRRPRIEDPGRRRGEPRAEAAGRPLHGSGLPQQRRWPPRGHDSHHVVVRTGRRDDHPHADLLPRQQVLPPLGGREEQDVGLQAPVSRLVGERRHGGVGDDPPPAGPLQQVRVVVQLQDDLEGPAGVGQLSQGRGLPFRPAQRTVRRSDGHAGEQGECHGDSSTPSPPGEHHGEAGGAARGRRELARREERGHRTDHPHASRDRGQPQVHPHPPGCGAGSCARADECGHTVTRSASSAAIAGPIPGTSSS